MAQKKTANFESALERLEEITELLENGEASLEDSIELYTEGLKIAGDCDGKLRQAEKKIRIIREKNGIATEEEFDETNE